MNMNNEYLEKRQIKLKQENEIIMKELVETGQKIDYLESRLDY